MKTTPMIQFDSKISISIICAIIAQLVTGVWWIAKLDMRIGLHEEQLKKADEVTEKVLRMEESVRLLHEEINQLENKLTYRVKIDDNK